MTKEEKKLLEMINDDNYDQKRHETKLAIIKIILVSLFCLFLIFAASEAAKYYQDNYIDIVYLADGSVYQSNHNDIVIIDGKCVIIDDYEYSWMYVDHIKLHQKKGE